jgi:hypothetical protein
MVNQFPRGIRTDYGILLLGKLVKMEFLIGEFSFEFSIVKKSHIPLSQILRAYFFVIFFSSLKKAVFSAHSSGVCNLWAHMCA